MLQPQMSNGDRTARAEGARERSYGQNSQASVLDRFGVWLSAGQIRRYTGTLAGKQLGDFGCGYHAAFVRTVPPELSHAMLVDFVLSPELKRLPKVIAIAVILPGGLTQLQSARPGYRSVHLCIRTSVRPVDCG